MLCPDDDNDKFGIREDHEKLWIEIVGNGCPKGRFRYYGKCKSYKEYRKSDYNDIDVTNEAQTFTPTTIIREDKLVQTNETDINLSIVPLSRRDLITEPNFIKLYSDLKTVRTVEKSTLLITELNTTVITQTPEVTSLSHDVSVSSPAMTEASQLEDTVPTSAVTESGSAKTESRPTFEEPKTVVTEPNQFIDKLSSTVVKLNPILFEPGFTVTKRQLLVTNPTLVMLGSTTESSVPTMAVTELLRSVVVESKSAVKQLKNSVTVSNHMLHELSSKVTKTTETNSNLTKSRLTETHQISTPAVVNIFSITDSTPTVLETTTATADTGTRIDSTLAVLEISPVGIESESVVTDHENILKDSFRSDSAVTAKSTPTTTWTEPFSNLASGPISSFTNTRTTAKESGLTTTDVPSKGVPDIFDQNDKVSNILLEVIYFMFTLVFVVSCVSILNWIFEQMYGILYRRRDQEYRGVFLSKEQESMV
ncbi:unnamed protein product [Arctia plantaginis]|uniref:Uncharacterized protein n=1 Tax=Arctia plantaginis TaxID=874455 RepID=A0A8S1BSB8_ARCPL|nr:unnamed protein product [Arctia plantaginis]